MKLLYTIAFLLITFSGCAQKNAFERFHISASQELAEDNIKSSKVINKNNDVVGIVTAVHLNKINPEVYHDHEYFYIYFYAKNKNDAISFSLNNKSAFLVEKLSTRNEFTNLTSFASKWNQYYLVSFTKQQRNLNLTIQIGKSSAVLVFKQNQ